jgi:SAM-dependent methyltransferase
MRLIASPIPQAGWFARRRFRAWAAPLRAEAVRWVDQATARRTRVWWIPPLPELSSFRLDPAEALGLLRRMLQRAPARAGDTVLWSLDIEGGYGLDDFEIRAVMGTFATVEHIWHTTGAQLAHRALAVGSFRGFVRAYVLHLSRTDSARRIQQRLRLLRRRRLVPILMTEPDVATGSDATARVRLLAQTIASGRAALALASGAHDVMDLRREVARVTESGLPSPTFVRLHEDFPWSPAILQELRRLGFCAGLSAWSGGGAAEPEGGAIDGSYQPGGSYVAAPFDRRIPAAVLPADPWVEIVLRRLSDHDAPGSVTALTQEFVRLEPLLDFARMEGYLSGMQESVPLQQRYHEYRVYNWPAPAPELVVQALDAGFVCERGAVERILLEQERSRVPGLRRPEDLVTLSSREALQRLRGVGSILAEQRESHAYLQELTDAPLRADIERFVAFVPPSLGSVLELGSGYGQLARRLRPRASSYALLELSLEMLRHTPASIRVAADIHQLPFRSGAFDAVVANNVMEHAYDPVRALAEVGRILAKTGALYALIPMDALNAGHAVPTHLWKADRRSVRLALEAAGLILCREELVDLYALGVAGAFPQCNGLVLAVEAKRRAA